MFRAFLCVGAVLGLGYAANAAIVPSWQVNPISTAAISDDPRLAGAISLNLRISIVSTLDWNSAGLSFRLAPGFTFYNHVFGGDVFDSSITGPSIFPSLAYDTAVNGTILGTFDPTHTLDVGSQFINVRWRGPVLNGSSEVIARFTLLGGPTATGSSPVFGDVRATLDPGTPIALPPLPIAAANGSPLSLPLPEPNLAIALIGIGLLGHRQRRRFVWS
jgi:hypothetical protein